MELTATQLYEKRKMNLAIFGLSIAIISSIANATFPIFNSTAMGLVAEDMSVADKMVAMYVVTLLMVALCELLGGLITVVYNCFTGYPLAEYGRVWKIKSSRMILISAILGGPIATACNMMATGFCGVTYTSCMVGLTPVVTAVLGAIFLKEKTGGRVIVGIVITVIGAIVATLAPPEGVTNFYLGIGLALVCPIAFALESIISTHAVDVCDPRTACPLYRMILSACMEIAIALVVCVATGHMAWFTGVFGTAFTSSRVIWFMILSAVFMAIQYNMTYTAYTYCGAIKASAILFSYSIWTIPVGLLLAACGVAPYAVTGLGILATIIVVIGIMLVIAKPSELFSLRDSNEE